MDTTTKTRLQVRQARTVYRVLIATILFLVAMFALAGSNFSPVYFRGFYLLVLPAAAAGWTYYRLKHLQKLLRLRECWAKPVDRKRDFEAIGSLFRYLHRTGSSTVIDDQTWHDLDLNRFYVLLDRALTPEGQSVLFRLLRTPCYTTTPLHERDTVIKAIQSDPSFRERVQLALLPLEGENNTDIVDLLWGQLPPPSPFTPLYTALALIALLSLFSPLLLGPQGLLFILGLFSLNTFVHHRVKRNIVYELPAISRLAVLLRAAATAASITRPEMAERNVTLRQSSTACRKIYQKTRLLQPQVFLSDMEMLFEYVKYFFLLEVRTFYAALNEIEKQMKHLRQIYLILGELDALQAVASYRENLNAASGYAEPRLAKNGNASFDATKMRHPLLNNAVTNSFTAHNQGVIITGSNMSGKSTFLRTVGLNALLAQTIFTGPAEAYRSSFFRILTSISREDSLAEGKSFYYQEAERLLKLIRAAGEEEAETPALCIIDELLSGTNFTERLAASEAILNHLARENALVVVATHDLDLAEKLQKHYHCYHFTDQVSRDGLHFDYKLKNGLATTRNAIKLLAQLGYPSGIVAQAEQAAEQHP